LEGAIMKEQRTNGKNKMLTLFLLVLLIVSMVMLLSSYILYY